MNWVLCDTNIFISAFNGIEKTISDLSQIGSRNVLIPSISVMELYRGMGNKQEMSVMKKKIKAYNILDFDERVSQKAIEFIQVYKLSHDLKIPDAIIGAMSVVYEVPLFTYNTKDFKYLPGIKLFGRK